MVVRSIRTFTVLPHLPERLQPLHTLAYNLWWCWHPDAIALFRRIDPDLFESLDNSPVRLLGATPQERLASLATRTASWPTWSASSENLDQYLKGRTWFGDAYGKSTTTRQPRPPSGSPISRPSSAFTRAFRSIRAASACWPAIT